MHRTSCSPWWAALVLTALACEAPVAVPQDEVADSDSEDDDDGDDDGDVDPSTTGSDDVPSDDTSDPSPDVPAVCGDGFLDGEEECDGSDLGDATCADYGAFAGELSCRADCT